MKGNIVIKAIFAVFILASSTIYCGRAIKSPVSPPKNDQIPETPSNLNAMMGDETVLLSWSVSDTQSISKYRVYMSDSVDNQYSLLGEVTQSSYQATNCRNGIYHYFKVSSINNAGFEGYKSEAVAVIPNLYGLLINNGEHYTGDRTVTLNFLAPIGTTFMQISDSPDFSGAQWESFVMAKNWQLAFGDGAKAVYGKFRDSAGHCTIDSYRDSITLDTHALIDSVIFIPFNVPFISGNTVHFKSYAGEPEGEASITIGQNLVQLELFDNGSRGDAVSGDGIYELNYTIPNNLDFENASVYGNFTDHVNNNAQRVQAPHNISVRRNPDPVIIFSISAPNRYFDRLILNWGQSEANDFAYYAIYRSLNAGVDSTDFLVTLIYSIGSTTLTDTTLNQNTRYYYKAYVVDNTGLCAGSNEVSAMTNQNTAPDPSILFPIVSVPGTHDRLQANWSAAFDPDFSHYELYRSSDSTVTQTDRLVYASTGLACIDSSLGADSTYYYRVLAIDRAGNSSWSNVERGHTGHIIIGLNIDLLNSEKPIR